MRVVEIFMNSALLLVEQQRFVSTVSKRGGRARECTLASKIMWKCHSATELHAPWCEGVSVVAKQGCGLHEKVYSHHGVATP
ncbi:hypothetical protein Plhal304r1_c017g0062941 [Plasmopara halstedii]